MAFQPYFHKNFKDRLFTRVKLFLLETKYSYYNYHDKANTIKNKYSFLDADLYFQQDKNKWEFKLSATNILNTGSLNQDSFSQYITSTSQYVVQPRHWMFSVKYNL